MGVDIVVIGCVVDSVVMLVVCIYEFGWWVDDWNKLV